MIVREIFAKLGFQVDQRSVAQADQAIARMRQRMQGLTGNVRLLGSAVGGPGGAAAGIGRLTAGLLGLHAAMRLGSGLMTTLVEFERLKAQLETITGSAEAADQSLRFVARFARQTPFDVEQTVGAFMRLRQGGIDPTEERLTALGNVAAAFSGDIGRLVEAAINTSRGAPRLLESILRTDIDLLSAPGKVRLMIGGVRHEIERSTPAIIEFLETLGETSFAGSMARQMDSLVGATANLRDVAIATAWRIGDGGLTASLVRLFRTLIATGDESQDLADQLGRVLGRAVDRVTDAVQFLRENSEDVVRVIQIMGSLAVASTVNRLAASLVAAAAPARLLATALLLIPLIIDDIMHFIAGDRETFLGRLLGKEASGDVRGALVELGGPIVEFVEGLLKLFQQGINAVGDLFSQILGLAGSSDVIRALTTVFKVMADVVNAVADGIDRINEALNDNVLAHILGNVIPGAGAGIRAGSQAGEAFQRIEAGEQRARDVQEFLQNAGTLPPQMVFMLQQGLMSPDGARAVAITAPITVQQSFGPAAATPAKVEQASRLAMQTGVDHLQRESRAAGRGSF